MQSIVPVSHLLHLIPNRIVDWVTFFQPLEDLHSQIADVLRMMLVDTDGDPSESNPGWYRSCLLYQIAVGRPLRWPDRSSTFPPIDNHTPPFLTMPLRMLVIYFHLADLNIQNDVPFLSLRRLYLPEWTTSLGRVYFLNLSWPRLLLTF